MHFLPTFRGCAMLLAWIYLFFLPQPVFSDSTVVHPRVIKVVADDNYPPFIFRAGDGLLKGYLVDEWRLWEKKTGVKVVIEAMDWGLAQQKLQGGEADVIETIFKTPERIGIYDFTKPYITLEVPVFYHRSLSGIVDATTLRGFTIGVKAGDACIEKLAEEGITTIKSYPNYEQVIEAAGKGEIRVFCVDREPALYFMAKMNLGDEFRMAFTLYSGQFHRAVMKGNHPMLALVNEGFNQITAQELETLEKRWLGTELVASHFPRYLGVGALAVVLLAAFFAINLVFLRYRIRQRTRELEQKNQQIHKNEEKYKTLVNNTHESIYVVQDHRLVFANLAACRTVGLNEKDLIGRPVADFIPVEDQELSRQIYDDLVQGKLRSNVSERRLITPSGELKDHLINSVRIDWEGKPSTLNFATEITGIKTAAERLASERKLLRTVIDHLPDAVYMKDAQGRKLLANKADIANVGLPESQIIGRTDAEVFPPDVALNFRTDDDKVLLHGEMIEGREEVISTENGKKRWLLTSKIPLFDDKGQVTGLVGIGRDITFQKDHEASLLKQNLEYQQLNEEHHATNEELNRSLSEIQSINSKLREAKKRSEESDQLKMAFLSNISHEIRTPLNGIIGFAEQLENASLSVSERIVYSKLIYESGQRLTAVINDIVDISLLQTQQAKLSPQPVDLVEVVSIVLLKFTESARQVGLTLTADISAVDSLFTVADGQRLTQILAKLLDNALKFTPSGGVRIGLRPDSGNALFYVKDTGIGISPEMQEAIFSPFRQADSNSWKNYGGQGLGLSIVRGFVELMGGRIWFTSRMGEGSTFWISIPLRTEEPVRAIPASGPVFKVRNDEVITILAAEDEMSNYVYLETILSKGPYRLIHALNGAEAIDLFKSNPQTSLILMDIKMPVMDGFKAFQVIKAFNPSIPVVALTAFAMADEAARIKEAGFDGYLTKPYRRADLLNIIGRFV